MSLLGKLATDRSTLVC